MSENVYSATLAYLRLVEIHLVEAYVISAFGMALSSIVLEQQGIDVILCFALNVLIGLFGVFFANPVGTVLDPCSFRLRLKKSWFDDGGSP